MLLEQRGSKEGIVDHLPPGVQRRPHARLTFVELRLFDRRLRRDGPIEQSLIDAQVAVERRLRRREERLTARQRERRRGHVGLILCETFDRHRRQPLRGNVTEPQVGLLLLQRQLAHARIGLDGGALQRRELE